MIHIHRHEGMPRQRREPGALAVVGGALALLAGCSAGGGETDVRTDRCPGEALSLGGGESRVVSGSTVTLSADYRGYCGDSASGPDAVYTVHAQVSGTLQVDVQTDHDSVVYAVPATECGDARRVLACTASPPGSSRLRVHVTAGSEHSIILDTRGEGGDYEATLTLAGATCGDGVLAPGEACDFGPDDAANGCTASCQFMDRDEDADLCPGLAPQAQIKAGKEYSFEGFTTGYHDDYHALSSPTGGPDVVYELHPISAGTLTVKASAGFDVVLAAYTQCSVQTGQLDGLVGIADSPERLDEETLTFAADALHNYHVLVDGYDGKAFGHYALTVTLE